MYELAVSPLMDWIVVTIGRQFTGHASM